MLFWALIWAYFWLQHIYKTIKDSSYSARPVASRKANIRAAQGRLHRTSCGHSGQPAVPLAPVCERCRGVGGAPGGARASQRVTRPEERRGEERGKVSTTACHRQTDDTSTGLHAGDLAVITPHTHTHTNSCMHTHCYQTDWERCPAPEFCLSLSVSPSHYSFMSAATSSIPPEQPSSYVSKQSEGHYLK